MPGPEQATGPGEPCGQPVHAFATAAADMPVAEAGGARRGQEHRVIRAFDLARSGRSLRVREGAKGTNSAPHNRIGRVKVSLTTTRAAQRCWPARAPEEGGVSPPGDGYPRRIGEA